MARYDYYQIFLRAIGRAARIETADGAMKEGVITMLDDSFVYIHVLKKKTLDDQAKHNFSTSKKRRFAIPLAAIISVEFMF